MNFHNLEYFVAIADDGNITKAAERLHVSQQSLSEMLKKLEDEVGTPLIKRGRPIVLTQAGIMFLDTSKKILELYTGMIDGISEISAKEKTKITLAVPATEMPQFLPELLACFGIEHPEIEVKIVKCEPKEATKMAGNFDLYFSTLPLGNELENIPIMEDTYAVAFTPNLAKRIYGDRWPEIQVQLKKNKNIDAIREMPFIFLCNRMNELVLDQQIIFREAGIVPTVVFQSDNGELNSNMCKLGTGAYVATMDYCKRIFQQNGKADDIMLFPIDTVIDPVVIALSHRRGMLLTKADKVFINTAKKFLAESQETN